MLRDILRGEDPQIDAVVDVITRNAPDILVLQSIDYDLNGQALAALVDRIRAEGVEYPHVYASQPNTGIRTNIDMDGNRRRAEARDTQSYGRFSGQGGMAVLSRYDIIDKEVLDYSQLLWTEFPEALLPHTEDGPFPSKEAQDIQRLSTTAHWVIPIDVPQVGRVHLLTFHASPPVFDGPEDRNGKRNHDEIMFWPHFLDGLFDPPPSDRFFVLGDANQDPDEGEGIKSAIRSVLNDPRLQDPVPTSAGSFEAGDDYDDTADWDDPVPGNMRVDYVLPSSDWSVTDAGVYWPTGPEGDAARTASRHRLVWVDVLR